MLESTQHEQKSFVTLTYNDEHLPKDSGLSITDYQAFLKKLRKSIDNKIRFYIVGEYGSHTDRPHYHLALFGFTVPERDTLELKRINQLNLYSGRAKTLLRSWGRGNVHIGEVTVQSMAYSCSHITKSTHKQGDPVLHGRQPEFSRMSLRPGIGKPAIQKIVDWLTTREGARHMQKAGDVPNVVRMDGKLWPIGRYLKTALRAEIGMLDEQTDLFKYRMAMRHMENIKEYGYEYRANKRNADLLKADRIVKNQQMRAGL
jgi:hypothetical protein